MGRRFLRKLRANPGSTCNHLKFRLYFWIGGGGREHAPGDPAIFSRLRREFRAAFPDRPPPPVGSPRAFVLNAGRTRESSIPEPTHAAVARH